MKPIPFKKIALLGRRRGLEIPETIVAAADYLAQQGFEVILEAQTAELLENPRWPTVLSHQLGQKADIIVVVGGDGSLINAAHIAVSQHLPVVGVNRGNLGFLTDIHPDELSQLAAILNGNYTHEERFLLQVSLEQNGQVLKNDVALNDVVLFPGQLPHMIYFDIEVNGQFVCHLSADGLIISTPTGSTAYALSAGGPILHPHLNAILLVPMMPHRLSNRPFVVDAESVIEVKVSEENEAELALSCDGQERLIVPPGARLCVQKHAHRLQLIHPKDYHYFKTLREKLRWQG